MADTLVDEISEGLDDIEADEVEELLDTSIGNNYAEELAAFLAFCDSEIASLNQTLNAVESEVNTLESDVDSIDSGSGGGNLYESTTLHYDHYDEYGNSYTVSADAYIVKVDIDVIRPADAGSYSQNVEVSFENFEGDTLGLYSEREDYVIDRVIKNIEVDNSAGMGEVVPEYELTIHSLGELGEIPSELV